MAENPVSMIEGKGFYDGNTLKVSSVLGEYCFEKGTLKLEEKIPQGSEFDCVLGIRPELVNIHTKKPAGENCIEALVYASQPAGAETIVTLETKDTQYLALQVDLRKYDHKFSYLSGSHGGNCVSSPHPTPPRTLANIWRHFWLSQVGEVCPSLLLGRGQGCC